MLDPGIALLVFFSLVVVTVVAVKSKAIINLLRTQAQREKILTEDILKLLYHIEGSNRMVGINAISTALKTDPEMLLKQTEQMASDGLLTLSNEDIILTERGREYAIKMVRTHRLYEKYLSERTGVSKKEWHGLAEKKEHELTEEDIQKLDELLGHPRFDPHGDPIPTASGEIIETNGFPLSNMSIDLSGKIIHIEDEPKVVYDQILAHNLHLGSQVKVISTNEDSISFLCEGKEIQLSPIVASNIAVRELNELEEFEEDKVRLTSLEDGESAKVVGISSECRGANRRRLLDLGFVKGTPVKLEYPGPLKNPNAYMIRNTLIALRKDQTDFVLIEKD